MMASRVSWPDTFAVRLLNVAAELNSRWTSVLEPVLACTVTDAAAVRPAENAVLEIEQSCDLNDPNAQDLLLRSIEVDT